MHTLVSQMSSLHTDSHSFQTQHESNLKASYQHLQNSQVSGYRKCFLHQEKELFSNRYQAHLTRSPFAICKQSIFKKDKFCHMPKILLIDLTYQKVTLTEILCTLKDYRRRHRGAKYPPPRRSRSLRTMQPARTHTINVR
jgi:hypothetical protein